MHVDPFVAIYLLRIVRKKYANSMTSIKKTKNQRVTCMAAVSCEQQHGS